MNGQLALNLRDVREFRTAIHCGAEGEASAITVVLPYYNEVGYLEGTLSSLLAQDLPPRRLILVDNVSDDGSADLCRALTAGTGIDVLHLHEPRPGKTHAVELGLSRVETSFVAFCDADTYYPPHYLKRCAALLEPAPEIVAAMAIGVYGDPDGFRERLRRIRVLATAAVLRRQAHTGGFGQSFRTDALRRVGGFSARQWPFVLEDHEIMQRLFKVGRSRYAFDLWCKPSPRRKDRTSVTWTLAERLLYHVVPFGLKNWFFYRFLAGRFARRGLSCANLREKPFEPVVNE